MAEQTSRTIGMETGQSGMTTFVDVMRVGIETDPLGIISFCPGLVDMTRGGHWEGTMGSVRSVETWMGMMKLRSQTYIAGLLGLILACWMVWDWVNVISVVGRLSVGVAMG